MQNPPSRSFTKRHADGSLSITIHLGFGLLKFIPIPPVNRNGRRRELDAGTPAL